MEVLTADLAARLLLGNIAPEHFFSTVWQTQHLQCRAADNPGLRRALPGLVSLDSLDLLLATSYAAGRRPADSVTMVQGGTVIPADAFMTHLAGGFGRLDAGKVIALHQQGASIALNSLHTVSVPVSRWCALLSEYFRSPIHANAYLTPPHSQGYSLHYDTHDVFLVQVAGRKTWEIVESDRPLSTTIFADSDTAHATGQRSCVELQAGDVLYLPRGMFHEGSTSDVMSAHLTVGVHPYTLAMLLRDLLTSAEADIVELRRCVTQPLRPTVPPADDLAALTAILREGLLTGQRVGSTLRNPQPARLNSPVLENLGHLTRVFDAWASRSHDGLPATATASTSAPDPRTPSPFRDPGD